MRQEGIRDMMRKNHISPCMYHVAEMQRVDFQKRQEIENLEHQTRLDACRLHKLAPDFALPILTAISEYQPVHEDARALARQLQGLCKQESEAQHKTLCEEAMELSQVFENQDGVKMSISIVHISIANALPLIERASKGICYRAMIRLQSLSQHNVPESFIHHV